MRLFPSFSHRLGLKSTFLVKAVFALAQLCVAVFNPFLVSVLGARDEAELCVALLYRVAAFG